MSNKNKYKELPIKESIKIDEVVTNEVANDEPISNIIIEIIEDKNPMHTKYAKFINQAKEGYVVGFEYPFAMEMLRYCENKRHQQFGLNLSCPACMINLILMFESLREN